MVSTDSEFGVGRGVGWLRKWTEGGGPWDDDGASSRDCCAPAIPADHTITDKINPITCNRRFAALRVFISYLQCYCVALFVSSTKDASLGSDLH
jgi:hypothetical protein